MPYYADIFVLNRLLLNALAVHDDRYGWHVSIESNIE